MVTEDVECDVKKLLVYTGHGDVIIAEMTHNRAHFHGNHMLLSLDSSVTNSNGQTECVFRCDEDMCHYVFISVQNVPDESSGKICEVIFN